VRKSFTAYLTYHDAHVDRGHRVYDQGGRDEVPVSRSLTCPDAHGGPDHLEYGRDDHDVGQAFPSPSVYSLNKQLSMDNAVPIQEFRQDTFVPARLRADCI